MATSSTEQRELTLVEKLDFRILGVSNNEEKLQQLLKTYLAPLLLTPRKLPQVVERA